MEIVKNIKPITQKNNDDNIGALISKFTKFAEEEVKVFDTDGNLFGIIDHQTVDFRTLAKKYRFLRP